MNAVQPAWHELLDMLLTQHAHLPFSKFVQAATIRQDGRPANRTLTFRFFISESRLLFTADTRTEKMVELGQNPWMELCWYFTESRMQMRLLGTIDPASGEDQKELAQARDRTWRERTAESRQSFTWPRAGQALSHPSAFTHLAPALAPENFGMLLFSPQRVETLDLSRHPHGREVHSLEDGTWQTMQVNP